MTLDGIIQSIGYEYFFRSSRELTKEDVQMFIICSITPRADRLTQFGYTQEQMPGLLHAENIYVQHVPLILLNELTDEPHNAFVKAFASRKKQKTKAFSRLKDLRILSGELVRLLDVLQALFAFPERINMNDTLTLEHAMEVGEQWVEALFANMTNDELDTYIAPEYKQNLVEQGIEQGLEQGLEQGKKEVARNLYLNGFALEEVAKLADLTIDEAKELFTQISKEDNAPVDSDSTQDSDNVDSTSASSATA